jgi:hypothetical protein
MRIRFGWKMFDRRILIIVTTLAAWIGVAYSQPKPQPQDKSSTLGTQQSNSHPAPAQNPLTLEQITKAIADGINTAAKQYDNRHPASPPDNSGWWFNFLLVTFTGGLVIGGAGQCFLFFWTLRATQNAAEAAKLNAEAVIETERARLFIIIDDARELETNLPLVAQVIDNEFRTTAPFNLIYRFKNHGRTPAIIKEIGHRFEYAKEGELNLYYFPLVPLPIGQVIDAAAKSDPLICRTQTTMSVADVKSIFKSEASLWFHGYVAYDDTFGWGRELRFVWHYAGLGRGMSLYSYREIHSAKRHSQGERS